jgi:hypothetical protein
MNIPTRMACVACLAGAQASTPAWSRPATPADEDATPVLAELVPDEELAHARGKYLGSSLVSGFMVQMVTRWQNDKAIATATASVSAAGLAVDHAIAQASANLSARVQALGSAPVTGNGGTANSQIRVDGVGQITQIAGEGNTASNVGTIATTTGPLPPVAEHNPAPQVAQGNGMTASATIGGAGGIQLAIESLAGQAIQSAQSGSLTQATRITGDAQQVLNQTNITLQIQQMSIRQLSHGGMRDALRAIATMRR